jgi:hypothetical protein
MEQNVTLSRFLNLLVSFSYPSTVLQHGNVQYNPSVVTRGRGGGGGDTMPPDKGKDQSKLHGPWIAIDRVQGKQQSIHGQARSLYFVGLS